MHPVIRDVAAALGDKAKSSLDWCDKNQELADALRIKGLPTLMIYKGGQMIWKSGELDANTLVKYKSNCNVFDFISVVI
jgi:thioredoxin 1